MRSVPTIFLALTVVLGSCASSHEADVRDPEQTVSPATADTEPRPTTTTSSAEAAVLSATTTTTTVPASTSTSTSATTAPATTTTSPSSTTSTTTTTSTTVPTTTTTEPPTTTTTTTSTTTTIPAPTTATTDVASDTDTETEDEGDPPVHQITVDTVEFMPGLHADIHAPVQPGSYPVVILAFGGGWTLGDRTQLTRLARFLAAAGVVAVNGEHRTLLDNRRMADMVEEVGCLAAAAPHLAAPYLTEPPGPVWLLGFSSGAHLAAVFTLTENPLLPRCPHEPGKIAGMIGLAGPYDLDEMWNEGLLSRILDSATLGEEFPEIASFLEGPNRTALRLFLGLLTGATPEEPRWKTLDPISLAPNHPHRRFLLITGAEDRVVPASHSSRFALELITHGHRALTYTIPDADHQSLLNPQKVGEIILDFLAEEIIN